MLPELFDHQDQNVRASSKGLTLELCRWIGKEPVKSILFEKMRDTMVNLLSVCCFKVYQIVMIYFHDLVIEYFLFLRMQKKELEAELANVTGTARPSRKIRYICFFSYVPFANKLKYLPIFYAEVNYKYLFYGSLPFDLFRIARAMISICCFFFSLGEQFQSVGDTCLLTLERNDSVFPPTPSHVFSPPCYATLPLYNVSKHLNVGILVKGHGLGLPRVVQIE